MIKIAEDLYMYRGIEVKKLDNGMYRARFYVNSVSGMCKIEAVNQQVFKKVFDKFVRQNKGLNIERYQRSLLMR